LPAVCSEDGRCIFASPPPGAPIGGCAVGGARAERGYMLLWIVAVALARRKGRTS
jgi:hypothetical protein